MVQLDDGDRQGQRLRVEGDLLRVHGPVLVAAEAQGEHHRGVAADQQGPVPAGGGVGLVVEVHTGPGRSDRSAGDEL